MTNKERVIIYIDGSNLYHKLKSLEIPNTRQFNYSGLCNELTKNKSLLSIIYYVGIVRPNRDDTQTQRIYKGQNILFNNLIEQNIIIRKGYLMKNNDVYHEKGVDVNIAVDILVEAYENHYDTALLISSDTDLIPAIIKAKSLRKKIGYIGFIHSPSTALKNYATFYRLLRKNEILPFIKK